MLCLSPWSVTSSVVDHYAVLRSWSNLLLLPEALVFYTACYIVCVQVRSKVASRRRYPSIVPSLVKLTF
jgi:hypothetical protein